MRRLAACLVMAIAVAEPGLASSPATGAAGSGVAGPGTPAADPGTRVGGADHLRAFMDESLRAFYDSERAARVEGFVIQRDAGRWTLTGWIFLRRPVQGFVWNATFFGQGRFELAAPTEMEAQQVRRFLGTDTIDYRFERCTFSFTGADDQRLFEALERTPAHAEAARAAMKGARDWAKRMEDLAEDGWSEDEIAERTGSHYLRVLALYERFLYPDEASGFWAAMRTKADESDERALTDVRVLGLTFGDDPGDAAGEVSVRGQFNHGRNAPWSVVTRFHSSDQYDSRWRWAGTSERLEEELETAGDFRIERNVVRAEVHPGASDDVRARCDMDVVVRADGLRALLFGVTPFLGTTRAVVGGEDVPFVHPRLPTHGWLHAGIVTVPVSRPLARGERVAVTLELEGHVLERFDGDTWIVKAGDSWLPWNGVGATSLDTTLIVPRGFTGLAPGTGSPCRAGDAAEGRDCFRWVTPAPIGASTLVVGREMRAHRGTAGDGTPVVAYTPRMKGSMGPDIVERAVKALAVHERWFGPYPYEELRVAPHLSSTGRGFASLLVLPATAFVGDDVVGNVVHGRLATWHRDLLVGHETAHQWWGGAAGIRSAADQWFSEGFAQYGAVLVLEQLDATGGTDSALREISREAGALLEDDGYMLTRCNLLQADRHASPENREGYERRRQDFMYGKGMLVMHMLRTVARALKGDAAQGDELFRTAMHDFFAAHSGGAPSTLDLLESLSRSYGASLGWFFKQWVYGTGHPRLEFSHRVVPRDDGGFTLEGRIVQADTSFAFPLTVSMQFGKGREAKRADSYQWIETADHAFAIGLPARPDKVVINEDWGLLCTWKEVPWSGHPEPRP